VVHEKIFEDLSTLSFFAPYWASKGASPFIWTNLSPSPKHLSYQVWLKLAYWFLRRSHLKEKVNAAFGQVSKI